MRTLMEQLAEEDSELVSIDGIKVLSPSGWVLVVPDPERAHDARVGRRCRSGRLRAPQQRVTSSGCAQILSGGGLIGDHWGCQ